jgi:CheY-like chemotaxis protein
LIHPDLIITDLMMPEMDGYKMMRQLRKIPELQNVPAIASSASVFESNQNERITAGVNAYPVTNLFDNGIILIVDDVPNNLKVLSDTLANAGFEVAIATSGESALQQLEHTPVSLILLDVMMPGMNGFETCHCIKGNAKTRNIPIIFVTALSESVNKVTGFELGAVDYITKPFQQGEVLARVRSHLKLNYLSQSLEARNTELQQLTEQLEQRVTERTQELFGSIETLKRETLSRGRL